MLLLLGVPMLNAALRAQSDRSYKYISREFLRNMVHGRIISWFVDAIRWERKYGSDGWEDDKQTPSSSR
jgi:hypothetical protein